MKQNLGATERAYFNYEHRLEVALTKPTQAQIEAAAQAMMRDMFAPHELPKDEWLQNRYRETAKAALTAAAQVAAEDIRSSHCDESDPSVRPDCSSVALTATIRKLKDEA